MSVTIGSLFAGIGGFELGLERSIPGAETIWQVEQDPFCQKVLAKHWPKAKIYNDVRAVGADNLAPIDLLCGGFPCQDISNAGKQEGIHGKKSGLWFEMRRIINELRPRIVVMENVAAITRAGGAEVIASLASIGYDAEWIIISAADFGAPHKRRRWFCVAYSKSFHFKSLPFNPFRVESTFELTSRSCEAGRNTKKGYWKTTRPPKPVICGMDDGIPARLDRYRLKALGNSIVPQCSEFIGKYINGSGLLD